MDIIVIQQAQNLPTGRVFESDLSNIDNQNSQIETTPFVKEFPKMERVEQVHLATNKTVIGYTSQGLPFLLAAHRVDTSPTAAFDFIDQFVIPRLYLLAQKLSVSATPVDVIRAFIRETDDLRKINASTAEFTLALTLNYEKADGIRCAGFSIGDLGIVKRNIEGIIGQLAYGSENSTAPNVWLPDRFCNRDENAPDLAAIMDRNCIFTNIAVEPGCELCSYTYLFPELLVPVESPDDQPVRTRRLNLNSELVQAQSKVLFEALKRSNLKCYSSRREAETSQKGMEALIEDALYGRVVIPNSELRMVLSKHVAEFDAARIQNVSIDNVKSQIEEMRPQLIDTIASSLLRIRLPRKHQFRLFSTGITVLCHHERAEYLISAMRLAPTLTACLRVVRHQLSFYDDNCELPRPPLPAWLDLNVKHRLEQGFNRPALKGLRGFFALLLLIQTLLNGTPPDVTAEQEDHTETGLLLKQ